MKAFAVIAALILMGGVCRAWEWPTLGHDPQRTGFSENMGPDSPNIAWTVNVGSAPSPPSVANHLVYFGADNVLYALSAFNGSAIWAVEADGKVSPPTVYNQRIYFGTLQGTFYCLSEKHGETVWTRTIEGSVTESVAALNDVIYVATSLGYLYALNASTGGLLWIAQLEGRPSAPAADGNLVVVATDTGNVLALDHSGRTVWSATVDRLTTSHPSIVDGSVWIGAGRSLSAMENGRIAKTFEFRADVKCAAIHSGRIYLGLEDGSVKAVFENGTEIWDFQTGRSVDSYLAAAGTLIFVSSGGQLYCLCSESGGLLWRLALGGNGSSTPTVAYGKVFIGIPDGRVLCIGSWGSIPNGAMWTGALYICIAFILLLTLYSLERIAKS